MTKEFFEAKRAEIEAFRFDSESTQKDWLSYATAYLAMLTRLEEKYGKKENLIKDLEGVLMDMIEAFFLVDNMVADLEGFFDIAFAERKGSFIQQNPKVNYTWAGEQALAEMPIVTFLFSKAKATRATLNSCGMHVQSVLKAKP